MPQTQILRRFQTNQLVRIIATGHPLLGKVLKIKSIREDTGAALALLQDALLATVLVRPEQCEQYVRPDYQRGQALFQFFSLADYLEHKALCFRVFSLEEREVSCVDRSGYRIKTMNEWRLAEEMKTYPITVHFTGAF